MRTFNDREKQLINYVLEAQLKGIVSMTEILEGSYFMESKGRALILQAQTHKAVLFLLTDIYANEDKRKEELQEFFEMVALFTWLKKEGYISLFEGPEVRKKTLFFVQDNFLDPTPTSGQMILNAKGDYTSSPDTIHDINKSIKYNGITFEADTFELIMDVAVGTLYCSTGLKDLVADNEPASPVSAPAETAMLHEQGEPKKTNRWLPVAMAVGILLLLICSGFIAYEQVTHRSYLSQLVSNDSVLTSQIAGIRTPDTSGSPQAGNGEQRLYGIDISHWNGNIMTGNIPDSLDFVICKATDGTRTVDNDFHQNWNAIKAKSLVRGAYHFFRQGDDPIEQADFFLKQVSQFDSTDMAPIVDIEQLSLEKDSTGDKARLQQDLLVFLHYVQKKCKRQPIIYTDYAFANDYLLNSLFAEYPLWLAEYSSKAEPEVPVTWKEKGYKIWQRSSSYDIDAHATDMDVYTGALADLSK